MESPRSLITNALGFSLLPSELIQYIVQRLALPDIVRLKSVNKSISSVVVDRDFVRDYNVQSRSTTWLFIYRKRWHRDAELHGFTDSCKGWFKVVIADLLKFIVHPGEDLYFLTGSGNFFLFALNTSQEVISVNPMSKTVKKIPPSPLGPRGTSSWRRSGMKLLSDPPGSNHFRFLFAEMHENRPVLFEYNSESNKWQSWKVRENDSDFPHGSVRTSNHIFLSAFNGQSESVVISVGPQHDTPVVVRPRFARGGVDGGQLAVGFSWGNMIGRLHVYGDGNMMIIRSDCFDDVKRRVRMLKNVELWGLSSNGRSWEFISRIPNGLIEQIKKPYGAMMGCLEMRDGYISGVLMSNLEGDWDIIWLCYDIEKSHWSWVPLPDCKMKGSNMAGIAISSGLTLC